MTNYQKGYAFEAEFVKQARTFENVKLAERFHKSVGPVWKPDYDNLNNYGNYKPKHAPIDSWYLTDDGRMHFAQMKRNTQISTNEMLDLLLFSMDMENVADVHLVTKIKKKVHTWKIQNSYVK